MDFEVTTTINQSVKTWDDLNLDEELLRGIYAYGFELPSDIQKTAIPHVLSGRDILAQSQSGTGKTGSFVISSLQMINTSLNEVQVVIISPTHELAKQILKVTTSLSDSMKNIKIKLMLGGTPIINDINALSGDKPHIIIGCIGRIHDMLRKEILNLQHLKLLVLDEADEMLVEGFGTELQNIFDFHITKQAQVALFSASMPIQIINLAKHILRDPVNILVDKKDINLKAINQYYIALPNDNVKYDALKDLFSTITTSQCIIYCNTVNRVCRLTDCMIKDGFSVSCIHSSMEKEERKTAFESFQNGASRVLISSDITARGIDIQQVNVVVNFDVPKNIHTYLHRIGRSGRWGRKGLAINMVTQRDIMVMRKIESYYSIKIEELPCDISV